ncbi:hypothetical protein D3C75_147260 [compost metagenome]
MLGFTAQGIAFIFRHQRLTRVGTGKGEGVQGFVAQDPAAVRHRIQQLPVVGDQHKAAGPVLQKLLQPQQSGQIEVVAGFIQQQQIRLVDEGARQQQACVLSAAEGRRLQPCVGNGKAHPSQQGFSPPAQALALGHRQLRQDRVEHGQGVDRFREVLFHPCHQAVSGQRYRPGCRGIGAVEDLQQGTFAAAVIAKQTNAVAFFQGKSEVVKQGVEGGINTQELCSQ